MKFMVNYNRGFSNEGKIYEAKVVSRKLNGYVVSGDGGENQFLCNGDFTILEMSDEEKNMKVDFGR